ncbi:MAG: hypothetical protein M3R17_09500 [Bacteroidota bacterium]|nr:hypothetical protein [Bacteroidota bacterium]
MKKISSLFPVCFFLLIAAGSQSCGGDKTDPVIYDTVRDTIVGYELNDSVKTRFKNIVSTMPVPFDMLKQFSGAHLPFKGELLNDPKNAVAYNSASAQSFILGIYGADLAYMISQDKLGDAAPYLKAVRRLSDAVVVPSAFDANMLKRYESNQNEKDSMQGLVRSSYKHIDNSLQGNDRLALATLVLTGGWLESIYLTTQHIGNEQQNDKNKVLFDMISVQQPYLQNITELLGSFPNDSLCKQLHADFEQLKTSFPKGPNIPGKDFFAEIKVLRDNVAAIRNRYVSIQ